MVIEVPSRYSRMFLWEVTFIVILVNVTRPLSWTEMETGSNHSTLPIIDQHLLLHTIRVLWTVQRLPMQPNADSWELDPRVASLLISVSIQLPSGACVRLHLIWFRCQYLFAAEECLSLHISIILMLLWTASLSAAAGLCNPVPTSATSVGN